MKSGRDLVRADRDKLKNFKPIPPKRIDGGKIFKNVDWGEEVNVLKYPVPFMLELDGGRYIGTGCLVITCDLDEGWINFWAYRGMVYDEKSLAFYILPDKHGNLQR